MTPIDSELSLRIRIIRVVCIFFMMYVHVNPGLSGEALGPFLAIGDNVIVDFLGRASVPALSLISGFLMVHELQRRHFLRALRNRLRTLLMPMVVWNCIIILFSAVIFLLLQEKTTVYRELESVDAQKMVVGKLMALRSDGATTALNFLRDLFVCAALSPVLIYLVRRVGFVAVLAGWTVGLGFGYEPLVYRPAILMFYLFGVYCALDQRALHLRRRQAEQFGHRLVPGFERPRPAGRALQHAAEADRVGPAGADARARPGPAGDGHRQCGERIDADAIGTLRLLEAIRILGLEKKTRRLMVVFATQATKLRCLGRVNSVNSSAVQGN